MQRYSYNFMIKNNYQASQYHTPRRRHSSLFQRMEDQIHKISRKLSAAKQHRQTHKHSRKATVTHPLPQFEPLHIDPPEQTVRRSKQTDYNSRQMTKKFTYLADRTNLIQRPTRAPIRRLRFGLQEPENHDIHRLVEQNQALEDQLKMMKTACEEQAFKVGFLRAESRQRQNRHEQEKNNMKRQQLYLTKLSESYKIKVEKYKRMLGDEESLQLSLNDL